MLLERPCVKQAAAAGPEDTHGLGDEALPPGEGRDVVQHGDAQRSVKAAVPVRKGEAIAHDRLGNE
jgi:hypothetical protein